MKRRVLLQEILSGEKAPRKIVKNSTLKKLIEWKKYKRWKLYLARPVSKFRETVVLFCDDAKEIEFSM